MKMQNILAKSCPESFIICFDLDSNIASKLFSKEPEYKNLSVDVLQVMYTGDDYVFCEIVTTYDYQKTIRK